MASMSGLAKLQRAVSQLENVERLLLGLPKHIYKDSIRRETLTRLAREIFIIKETIVHEIAALDKMSALKVKNKWITPKIK